MLIALTMLMLLEQLRDDVDDGAVANMNNLDTTIQVSPITTTRIHKDHPLNQAIGDLQSATQTYEMISKDLEKNPIRFEDPDFPDRVYRWKKQCMDYIKLLELVYVDEIIFGSTKKELCIAFEKLMMINFQDEFYGRNYIFLRITNTINSKGITSSDVEKDFLDRKSTIGGCQFLGGRLISWQCKKQTVVANSITEAEYVAASRKAKKSFKLMMEEELFRMELRLMLVKTINWEVQLHALVDGKKIIVTESSVRRDHQLVDEEGVDCLPNSIIFEQLTLMGSKFPKTNCHGMRISEVEAGNGKHHKTQSKATPNESSSIGTTSGGGPSYQETIGDTIAQTRFESVFKHSNDSLLAREPVKPIKKKDIIKLDEEAALKLQAKFDEEERLPREKAEKEKEANIALIETWDDTGKD
ncbi:hypothetical protein Tco_0814097 [Tanacetum coccineum]